MTPRSSDSTSSSHSPTGHPDGVDSLPLVPPPDSPAPRGGVGLLGRIALVVLVFGLGSGSVWLLNLVTRPAPPKVAEGPPAFVVDRQYVDPGAAAPGSPALVPAPGQVAGATTDPRGGSSGADPVRAWADRLASVTDVPARALRAYANADLVMRTSAPACHISWATLAGIGRIESKHGRYGGARLGEDGRPAKPIIGVPLDGSPGFKAVPDTDGGALDGDPLWDHAVGPMQFLPATWVKWGVRANGDGNRPDPQNIDDAALAAGRYLCDGHNDMGTGPGWWQGVLKYNNSVKYGQEVFSNADAYARASLGG